MPRFFTDQIQDSYAYLDAEDARHVLKSLRMSVGEHITVCDGQCCDYDCVIESLEPTLSLRIVRVSRSDTEPTVSVHLFQALPKGEKMEWIIQKAVELGAADITPVLTSRCISRPDSKTMEKKTARYQKIALEAAKQCGRGIVPVIKPMLSFEKALEALAHCDVSILCYECGGQPLQKIVTLEQQKIGIMIGSEGGFSEEEAARAQECGVITATLGKRILRCETAPIAAISVVMNLTGNL